MISRLKMLRQWGGIVDMTGDRSPIIGPTPVRACSSIAAGAPAGSRRSPGPAASPPRPSPRRAAPGRRAVRARPVPRGPDDRRKRRRCGRALKRRSRATERGGKAGGQPRLLRRSCSSRRSDPAEASRWRTTAQATTLARMHQTKRSGTTGHTEFSASIWTSAAGVACAVAAWAGPQAADKSAAAASAIE